MRAAVGVPYGEAARTACLALLLLLALAAPAGAARLTQLPGRAGCIDDSGESGCAKARGMSQTLAVAVAPDGRHVYTAGAGLGVFERDRRTGRLKQLPGRAGCVSGERRGSERTCARARGLTPADVVVAPNGRTVYVTSHESAAVRAFARSPRSGRLRRLGCWNFYTGSRRCGGGTGLGVPKLAVTPDGRQLLVAAASLSVVPIRSRGRLGRPACLTTRSEPDPDCRGGAKLSQWPEFSPSDLEIAVSPNGERIFVAGGYEREGQVLSLVRNPVTGAIAEGACIGHSAPDSRSSCGAVRALGAALDVAVSADSGSVYVAGLDDETTEDEVDITHTSALAVFAAEPFAQLPGPAGCALFVGRDDPGCSPTPGFGVLIALAAAPDNAHVLAVMNHAVLLLERIPGTSELRRVPGENGCVARRGAGKPCGAARGLESATGVAISPDGRNAYVLADFDVLTTLVIR